MFILIVGSALWWAAHLFKRIAPERRARMGDSARGLFAGALIVSVVLMVIGYRMTDGPYWWGATPALKGINNLLILLAFYLFAADGMKTRITHSLRHPQLTGFALWAFAHLLVNGDLPSFVLFGGLLVWALVQMVAINRAEPRWTPPTKPLAAKREVMAVVGGIVVMGVVGLIHALLGYNPFGA